ncbi:MAG TPA: LemA family protein [Planctomycetota bacterium]|jgi:LemA protein|nr:LemA family protein [Planctomycetota bacterium]
MGTGTLIALGILAVLFLWLVALYNGLVALRNRVKAAWSQIDVQLKRRYDLIPNLVNTVKGYMKHEAGIFEKIAAARAGAMAASSPAEKGAAEGILTGALRQFLAVAENYPDVKANANATALMEELSSTENRIGFARQHYNDEVQAYNTRIETFPAVMVASMFNFTRAEFFELKEPAQREPVKVEF